MYVVGIDENGLGPRLGPMTTTAVTLDVGVSYQAHVLCARGVSHGLTDSKAVASSRKMSFAESVSLGLLHVCGQPMPALTSASSLLAALHLDGESGLLSPCPTPPTRALCHGTDLRLPAFGGSVEVGLQALAPLLRGKGKVRGVRVRSVISCVGVLNGALASGRNKLVVDLAAMERLAMDARERCGEPVSAICGMVGGIRDVPKFATHIEPGRYVPLELSTTRRAYRVEGLGSLAFEVDADANHLPVALASIVGKYLRELGMLRIVGFHRADGDGLGSPSGYHDPVTARFVDATRPIRARLAIVDDCFERRG